MKTRWSLLKDFFTQLRPSPVASAPLDEPPPAHLKPLVRPARFTSDPVAAPVTLDPDTLDLLLAEPVATELGWHEAETHALLLGTPPPASVPGPSQEAQPTRGVRVQQPGLFAHPLVFPVLEDLAPGLTAASPVEETPQRPSQRDLVRVVALMEESTRETESPAPIDDVDLLLGATAPSVLESHVVTPDPAADDLIFHTPLLPSPAPVVNRPERERRSARDRAEVLAARLIKTHKLDIEELGELADVLELGHHALTVGAIERLLARGASVEEVALCFDLRCLWAQERHFNTYYSYSRANRRRFQALSPQGLSWGLAYQLVQGFHGVPDLAELHCALEGHYEAWGEQPPYRYDSFVAYLSAVTEGYSQGLDGVHFGSHGYR